LGLEESERRKNYRALFVAQLDSALIGAISNATNGNYVLGNSRFVQEIEHALSRRVVKGRAGRPVNERS